MSDGQLGFKKITQINKAEGVTQYSYFVESIPFDITYYKLNYYIGDNKVSFKVISVEKEKTSALKIENGIVHFDGKLRVFYLTNGCVFSDYDSVLEVNKLPSNTLFLITSSNGRQLKYMRID